MGKENSQKEREIPKETVADLENEEGGFQWRAKRADFFWPHPFSTPYFDVICQSARLLPLD